MKNSLSKFVPVTLFIALMVAMAPPTQAQVPTTLTEVLCSPDGPEFIVDGGVYAHAMSAFWPIGSKHTLTVPQGYGGLSYNAGLSIQYTFAGWSWTGTAASEAGASASSTLTVTADPSLQQYVANFTTLYKFGIQYFSCSDPASCAASPGIIMMNGTPISSDTSSWQAPGASIVLQAFPNNGWIFGGWRAGPNQTIVGFQDTITLNAPMTVYPIFVPAKTINLATNPANLYMKLYADGVLLEIPASLQWGEGTVHSIAALATQNDNLFQPWVFTSWSDGGALSHAYTVGINPYPETITANYTPGARASFTTMPGGLNLTIDGQTLPPPYAFIWGIGTTHTLQAPLQQTDAQGGVWSFSKWDDGTASASRSLTMPAGSQALGIGFVAIYTGQSRLTVNSTVAGLAVTVDGAACTTPCSVLRPAGTQVDVNAPASVPQGAGSRQDFLGWSTNGGSTVPGDWVAALNNATTTINATYHLMNLLTATANPSTGAQWSMLPGSPDGFYDSQTPVSVAVTPRPGYKFANWTGDLSGTVPSGTLTMTVPRNVVAQLNAVPYISSPALSNAAGVTPQQTVAAGSVASIFGVNLASTAAIGPSSPLVQTLAGTMVHIGTNYLPLYFASPAQINLQVPPDLAPGQQTITVSPQGMPDVSANFLIARNAPGLFPMNLGGQSYALALHADGTLVTPDAPAAIGELLTVYGTGFGPTTPVRPFGFPVPATPPYAVVDAVSVQVGASTLTVESAYALPGNIGIDAVQFRLDNTVPSGASSNFQLVVNGVNSNTLLLPVQ
ncbi:MAG: hypothetical protein ABSF62_18235 [Bryobacteraceae bacterium]